MQLKPAKIREIEAEIAQIQNVSYCRLIVDERGAITNVDILSDTRRSPQRIVRDAEVIVRKHQVELDHRKIGVVQLVSLNEPPRPPILAPAPDAAGVPARPAVAIPLDGAREHADPPAASAAQPAVLEVVAGPERIQLGAVHCTMGSGSFLAEVELIVGSVEGLPGRAVGPGGDQEAALETIARATVEAVRNLLTPGYEALVREVRLLEIGGASMALVLLDFGRGRTLTRLCGTCLQRGSLYETAVFATLDALNRTLGQAEYKELLLSVPEATGTR